MKGKIEPDGEETWSLLQCWTDLVPLLGVAAQVHAAIVTMHMLVAKMYSTMHQQESLQAPVVAGVFCQHVYPGKKSPYLNLFEHNAVTTLSPGPLHIPNAEEASKTCCQTTMMPLVSPNMGY